MNEQEFRAQLDAAGYECSEFNVEPGRHNDEHTHPFDAKLFIQEGEFTLVTEGGEQTYRPGDSFAVAANTPHAERTGESGARGLVGKRHA